MKIWLKLHVAMQIKNNSQRFCDFPLTTLLITLRSECNILFSCIFDVGIHLHRHYHVENAGLSLRDKKKMVSARHASHQQSIYLINNKNKIDIKR